MAAAASAGAFAQPLAWSPATSPTYTRASPQRSKTLSMKAPKRLTRPVARASAPSNMSKTPPAKTTSPPASQSRLASEDGPDGGDAEPDERQAVRRQAQPAEGERDRLAELLDPAPGCPLEIATPALPQPATGGA